MDTDQNLVANVEKVPQDDELQQPLTTTVVVAPPIVAVDDGVGIAIHPTLVANEIPPASSSMVVETLAMHQSILPTLSSQPIVFLETVARKNDEKTIVPAKVKKGKKKEKKKTVQRSSGGMYGTIRRRASSPPPPSKSKLTRESINIFLQGRAASGSTTDGLFGYKDCAALNDMGDVRYQSCVLRTQLGKFQAGESFKIVDWLPSFSTILLSKSKKISDTVALSINPASVDANDDLLRTTPQK
jgi:hypothetical protein